MKIQIQLLQQIKKLSFLMLKIWFIYLLITGLIIGIGKFVYNINVWYFTKESNTILNGHFYIGAISNFSIILWTVPAALCIFSYIYLQRYNPDSRFRLFLLHAGIFTTWLLLDDVYMWHDRMFPVYLSIGQKYIYALYFAYTLFFLITFRKVIFKTEYIILLASLSLQSFSVLIDMINDNEMLSGQLLKLTGLKASQYDQMAVLFEDTFKGLGILTWLIYFSRTVFINVFSPIKNSGIETQNKINSISNHRS